MLCIAGRPSARAPACHTSERKLHSTLCLTQRVPPLTRSGDFSRLKKQEYPAAYAFMSASYRGENALNDFKTDFVRYSIESACDWHKPIRGSKNRATIYKYNSDCFLCLDVGPFIFLVKEAGIW